MIDLLAVFVFFFAVIDPIGTIPVFIAVTRGLSDQQKRRTALRAAAVAAGVLVFFVVAGELILEAIDIPLPAFQVAGGIVLFLFALTMIFGDGKPGIGSGTVGAVLGAALGGFLGSNVGNGNGQLAATAAGTIARARLGGAKRSD